jgi:hypothetical protein
MSRRAITPSSFVISTPDEDGRLSACLSITPHDS